MFSTLILTASAVYLLAFNAQPSLALTVTSPEAGASWNASEPLKVDWTSVSTDPETFDIQISNQDTNEYPTGWTHIVQKDVKASDGSATIDASGAPDLKVGSGFRINLVSDTNNNAGILAQSETFNVTGLSSTSGSHSNTTEVVHTTANGTVVHTTTNTTSTSGAHNNSTSSSTNPMSNNPSSTASNTASSDCSLLRPDQMSMILGVAALISVMIV